MTRNQTKTEETRLPIASGSYYPAEKNLLFQQLDFFHRQTELTQESPKTARMILVPHAGYSFSGQTASSAYQKLFSSSERIDNIFLIGSSHQNFFSQTALDSSLFWETPLGKARLNQKIIKKLCADKNFQTDETIHALEHSLEVQIPFIQYYQPESTVIPLLLGSENRESCQKTAEKISEFIQPQDKIILTSDLSHYPDYELALEVDQKTIDLILSLDISLLERGVTQMESRYRSRISVCCCSLGAMKTGMFLAKKMNLTPKLICYTNSGEKTGDKEHVVGYASIAFYE